MGIKRVIRDLLLMFWTANELFETISLTLLEYLCRERSVHAQWTYFESWKVHVLKTVVYSPGFVNNEFLIDQYSLLRDWSLITGRGGGATKREGGGACEVLPLQKWGRKKVLALLKGGLKKFWGSFYVVA